MYFTGKVFQPAIKAAFTQEIMQSGNAYQRENISTIDLLEPTSSDYLLLVLKFLSSFDKASILKEEVGRTERSPSVRVP